MLFRSRNAVWLSTLKATRFGLCNGHVASLEEFDSMERRVRREQNMRLLRERDRMIRGWPVKGRKGLHNKANCLRSRMQS